MSLQSMFDQLGEQRVPERPPEFRRRLHERINVNLTVVHVVEFAVRVLPFAFYHFFTCLCGAVYFSLTGRHFEKPEKPDKGDNHAE